MTTRVLQFVELVATSEAQRGLLAGSARATPDDHGAGDPSPAAVNRQVLVA